MASVTKNSDENTARDEDDTDDEGAEIAAASEKSVKLTKGGKGGGKEPAKAVDYAKPTTGTARRGFFTIYKNGQGYWTRMGTLIAVGVLGLLLAWTLYEKGPQLVPDVDTSTIQKRIDASHAPNATASERLSNQEIDALKGQINRMTEDRRVMAQRISLGIAIGFLVLYTAISLRMMNKPANVDFLIATDSEMKKVNWTSRKELIGSTKVVVFFMLLIAVLLFVIDWIFHLLFWAVGVLKLKPVGWPW